MQGACLILNVCFCPLLSIAYEFVTTYYVTPWHQSTWGVNPSSRFEDPALCMQRRRKQLLKAVLLVLPKYGVLLGVLKLACGKKMILPVKIGIGSGVTFFVILIFGWAIFPKILKSQVKSVSQWVMKSSAKYSSHIHLNISLDGWSSTAFLHFLQEQFRNRLL